MADVDVKQLRSKVQEMYKAVAKEPNGSFHFEMGCLLAVRLGYPAEQLDRVPAEAIDSFAGVGYHLGLAGLAPGERVLDLGSGSGMDAFVASLTVGPAGAVIGIDMTDAQLEKARSLAARDDFSNVRFDRGYIEEIPVETASVDAVISNGVINLSADKDSVFKEIARTLKPGGRMAISDIVTDKPLTDSIVCDVNLWAACIGGAAQRDDYQHHIESAGLRIAQWQESPQYGFISDSARGATDTFGVKSVSVLAFRS